MKNIYKSNDRLYSTSPCARLIKDRLSCRQRNVGDTSKGRIKTKLGQAEGDKQMRAKRKCLFKMSVWIMTAKPVLVSPGKYSFPRRAEISTTRVVNLHLGAGLGFLAKALMSCYPVGEEFHETMIL